MMRIVSASRGCTGQYGSVAHARRGAIDLVLPAGATLADYIQFARVVSVLLPGDYVQIEWFDPDPDACYREIGGSCSAPQLNVGFSGGKLVRMDVIRKRGSSNHVHIQTPKTGATLAECPEN